MWGRRNAEMFNSGRNVFHSARRNLDAKGQSVCDKALLCLAVSYSQQRIEESKTPTERTI